MPKNIYERPRKWSWASDFAYNLIEFHARRQSHEQSKGNPAPDPAAPGHRPADGQRAAHACADADIACPGSTGRTEADSFADIPGEEGCFAARKDGRTVAYIIPAESKGYGGKIKLLVAVDTEGKVLDFNILEHNETPGLGDNAQKPDFRKQFAGKGPELLEVTKDPNNKENIQAMTGATISSRAVAKGVKEAAEKAASLAKGGR